MFHCQTAMNHGIMILEESERLLMRDDIGLI